jgi:hypothetical protein
MRSKDQPDCAHCCCAIYDPIIPMIVGCLVDGDCEEARVIELDAGAVGFVDDVRKEDE